MTPSRRYNQTWLPDVFNDFFDNNWMERTNATAPAINIIETENSYDIDIAAPGMTKEDFRISLDDKEDLVINMEKKEENNGEKRHGHYLRREFSYSKFQQTMILPEDADKENIVATMENGILKISVPKLVKQEISKAGKLIEIK